MKRLILLVLAMVMCFTLIACANNDENNAAVLAKINELEAVEEEVYNYYNDNGLLVEGSADKETIDKIVSLMETTKTDHQKIVDGKGYSDEEAATVIEALSSDVEYYQGIVDQFTE